MNNYSDNSDNNNILSFDSESNIDNSDNNNYLEEESCDLELLNIQEKEEDGDLELLNIQEEEDGDSELLNIQEEEEDGDLELLNQTYMTIDDNFFQSIYGNDNEINNIIDSKYSEIMTYAYENMMNINDNIIKFMDFCYLKNLQYDDEPIDTIRYTIRTIFDEGFTYDIKELTSNIFGYSMIGINIVFNENFDILNEILACEVKRYLRRTLSIRYLSHMFYNNFQQMEDIKLVVSEDELLNIPTKIFKDLDSDIKSKNEKCTICQDEYRDNDTIRLLSCEHIFHTDCVDNWLTQHSHKCPCCRKEATTYIAKI